MKWLTYIFVAVLAFGLGWWLANPFGVTGIGERVDTVFSSSVVVRRDTIPHYLPTPMLCWHTGDTIYVGDTVLPVEQKVYADSNYTAYVSGYRPRLDSVFVYPTTTTITNDVYHTITKMNNRRWGLGLQAGYGYPGGWYIGIGVSYYLWRW